MESLVHPRKSGLRDEDRCGRPAHGGGRTTAPESGGRSRMIGRSQCWTAFSAPAPVSERTSISAYLAAVPTSRLVTVPSQPRKKASGMETMPGLSSGNQWKSIDLSVIIDRLRLVLASTLPETTGEKVIRMIADARPP